MGKIMNAGEMGAGLDRLAPPAKPARDLKAVYVAGPMRGLPDYNYPQFHEVAMVLRDKGLGNEDDDKPRVINPAENFNGDKDRDITEYLTMAVRQVAMVDALVLLPGWRDSEGTELEVTVALACGKRFFVAEQWNGDGQQWRFHEKRADYIRTTRIEQAKPAKAAELGTIEQEAAHLVREGERQQTYGHPRGDFDRVAAMWSAILGIPVTAEQVAIMMIAFKLARLAKTPQHHDTKVDVIGYAICLDRLDEAV